MFTGAHIKPEGEVLPGEAAPDGRSPAGTPGRRSCQSCKAHPGPCDYHGFKYLDLQNNKLDKNGPFDPILSSISFWDMCLYIYIFTYWTIFSHLGGPGMLCVMPIVRTGCTVGLTRRPKLMSHTVFFRGPLKTPCRHVA